MYNLPYFKEKDSKIVLKFMQEHPFVLLTGCDSNNKPVATQVPLLLEEKEGKLFFYGHAQRKTDHQLAFEKNPNVIALFTGPHTYVSASWYSKPQSASTWNYMTVHAKGTLRFLEDTRLLDILSRTTAHFENNKESPSLVHKIPEEYLSRMMQAIIPFEIEVTQVDNVFKLSQNRDKESYLNIISKLKSQGGEAASIAEQMEQRESQLFAKSQEAKDFNIP